MLGYQGPLRGGPLSIELYNTLYADAGGPVDGLGGRRNARLWLDAVSVHLSSPTIATPPLRELHELRGAVRAVFNAVLEGGTPSKATLEALNRFSLRGPSAPVALWDPRRQPRRHQQIQALKPSDAVLAEIAADAINIVTGPLRERLRACGAPRCVLVFLKDHPRREWCSPACGNRARQSRHYRKSRDSLV